METRHTVSKGKDSVVMVRVFYHNSRQRNKDKTHGSQRERFSSQEQAPDTSQLQNMLPNEFNNVHNNYSNQLIRIILF